jgi:2-succinyl-5-enolpyruvyl-6-hydroxy-3-cyclohexene-1-carboxylate synthase
VHLASRAYQVESSDGAAGMQGVESAALGAETAEECAGTADTVVAGTDTAADHSLLSDLLDGTGLPVVR